MSDIEFVNALGDEIERRAAERIASRRGRIRRRIAIGGLGFAIAATGVAAASGVFGTPEQLASSAVGCYDRASLNANVSVQSTGAASPVETCRRVLRTDRPLVACASWAVLVFPGRPGTCERLGLEPLPAEYEAARERVVDLGRRVAALERSADCIPPRELAARLDALLRRSGWSGWRADLRLDLDHGPCGWIAMPGGDGTTQIEGALDHESRRVIVSPGPAHSTMELLLGPGNRLIDASGDRCYTVEDLEELAHDRLDRFGRALTFQTRPAPGDVGVEGARGQRLEEGCAIIVGVAPTADDRGFTVEVWD
jgi:hypothetical protein